MGKILFYAGFAHFFTVYGLAFLIAGLMHSVVWGAVFGGILSLIGITCCYKLYKFCSE